MYPHRVHNPLSHCYRHSPDNRKLLDEDQESSTMNIKLLTDCLLRMIVGLQTYPLGAALLICLVLATAIVGYAWK